MDISEEEKRILLKAARDSIMSILTGSKMPEVEIQNFPALAAKAGAFVTLSKRGSLRGCIGYILSDRPLFETVCDAAVQASQYDPRFKPVELDEMPEIEIEISILSEPFPLDSYDEIIIGKHGLIMEEKGRRGLLLPQVAVEHNLSREEFLDAICQKTGFSSGYWQTKQVKLSAFTATVFSESEFMS